MIIVEKKVVTSVSLSEWTDKHGIALTVEQYEEDLYAVRSNPVVLILKPAGTHHKSVGVEMVTGHTVFPAFQTGFWKNDATPFESLDAVLREMARRISRCEVMLLSPRGLTDIVDNSLVHVFHA